MTTITQKFERYDAKYPGLRKVLAEVVLKESSFNGGPVSMRNIIKRLRNGIPGLHSPVSIPDNFAVEYARVLRDDPTLADRIKAPTLRRTTTPTATTQPQVQSA